jgi:hypothetical protein
MRVRRTGPHEVVATHQHASLVDALAHQCNGNPGSGNPGKTWKDLLETQVFYMILEGQFTKNHGCCHETKSLEVPGKMSHSTNSRMAETRVGP